MVAKRYNVDMAVFMCLNLAKIHMVAKLLPSTETSRQSLNLAKIHMVAKLRLFIQQSPARLNLAKIHMVAKLKCGHYLNVQKS